MHFNVSSKISMFLAQKNYSFGQEARIGEQDKTYSVMFNSIDNWILAKGKYYSF